jgi:prepilin-type N-terminal cleavage/methylation domain-containing protein
MCLRRTLLDGLEMNMLISRTQRGFSLIELVLAMAAFTIIIMGTMRVVAIGSKSYRGVKTVQTNLETAQFALNTMGKELRGSNIVSSNATSVVFFEYVQSRCIQYSFVGPNPPSASPNITLVRRSRPFATTPTTSPVAGRDDCATNGVGVGAATETLVTGLTSYALVANPSRTLLDPLGPLMGYVTVSLTVGTGGLAATVQTTVSLRDFQYVGITGS